jgi:hypothetical protein
MVSSVVSRHFHVELTDSPVQSHVSELFVNVVGVVSRLVLQGDSVSLHEVRVLFEYLVHRKHLSVCSLYLIQKTHLLPEFGFGQNSVFGKHTHGVNLWGGVGFSWFMAAGNQKLFYFHVH